MHAEPEYPADFPAMQPEPEEAREARQVPKWLWDQLRADPVRAPEHVALAAAQLHAPAAAEWAARHTGDRRKLAQRAVRRHVHYARLSGAAFGLGGWTTMAADLASLAWIQSRMVFFVAGALGWDPQDRMRPAELLVLLGVYDDPYKAREALDGTGTTVAMAYVGSLAQRDRRLVASLLSMVSKYGAKRIGGKVIPGFASIVNAVSNGGLTKDLGRRALHFYGGSA
jgi:EcsC protein family